MKQDTDILIKNMTSAIMSKCKDKIKRAGGEKALAEHSVFTDRLRQRHGM